MRAVPAVATELALALTQARAHTDQLFDLLSPTALYSRPIAERHRLIFYLGHLEAFDWNQVCRAGLGCASFHPGFDRLFEFGIDPEVGAQPADTAADWPEVEEVQAYNRQVREYFDQWLGEAPTELLNIALEHRLMHAETLAYLLHQVPFADKVRRPQVSLHRTTTVRNGMIDIPEGVATLGRSRQSGFGWDNEFEEHSVAVPAFRISRHMISNGEYLEFVKQGASAPAFWTRGRDGWLLRCMFDERPLPLNWPVYVTWEQAQAYAEFRKAELPTEAQWHRSKAREGDSAPGNFDFRRWDPEPVSEAVTGNGWQWTSTVFGPFPGFQPIPSYPGYSANFFDGQHYVLKGASPRTSARLARESFRNWFRPNYPYMYAGFRIVENK